MDFISIKDPHLSFGFQNRIRYDYENNVISKIDFVADYIATHNIRKVIMTGDIIDSSYEDKWSFKKYRVNKRQFQKLADHATLYSNVGNHDYFHGFENTENTIFGELCDEGIVTNLTKNKIYENVSNDWGEYNIIIQGIDYHLCNEQTMIELDNFNELKTTAPTFKVVVLHSNVTPKEVEHITDFTYAKLAESYKDIDMFICGHYHLGYPTKTIARGTDLKDATFINNWNLIRVVRDYEVEMGDHTPEFEHVSINYDFTTKKFVVMRATIQVPHKPYDETFRAKEVSLLRKTNSEKSNFFKEINITELISNMDLSDTDQITLLNEKRDENGYAKFSDKVLAKAIEYLNN